MKPTLSQQPTVNPRRAEGEPPEATANCGICRELSVSNLCDMCGWLCQSCMGMHESFPVMRNTHKVVAIEGQIGGAEFIKVLLCNSHQLPMRYYSERDGFLCTDCFVANKSHLEADVEFVQVTLRKELGSGEMEERLRCLSEECDGAALENVRHQELLKKDKLSVESEVAQYFEKLRNLLTMIESRLCSQIQTAFTKEFIKLEKDMEQTKIKEENILSLSQNLERLQNVSTLESINSAQILLSALSIKKDIHRFAELKEGDSREERGDNLLVQNVIELQFDESLFDKLSECVQLVNPIHPAIDLIGVVDDSEENDLSGEDQYSSSQESMSKVHNELVVGHSVRDITLKLGDESIDSSFIRMPVAIVLHPIGSFCFIADYCNHRIVVTDLDGKFVRQIGSEGSSNGQMLNPSALALDAENDKLYVTECGNHRVQVFCASDGSFITRWGSYGSLEGRFNQPVSIALHHSLVYVSDSLNHRIQVFSPSGEFIRKIGKAGSAKGEFRFPRQLCIYEDRLFVADQSNNRVQYLDLSKAEHCMETFANAWHPSGVTCNSRYVYISEIQGNVVRIFEWGSFNQEQDEQVHIIGEEGERMFHGPYSLYLDPRKIGLYVADYHNYRIKLVE